MKNIDIKEAHKLLLEIAKEIHIICKNHNIPYYILGGTMLGAIRHNGFIPWDDDMDFGIPREYYNKFIELCNKEFPPHLQIQTIDNSDYVILCFAKVSDLRTIAYEKFAINATQDIGINIDVFPLDHTNYKKSIFSFNWYIRTVFRLQKLLFMNAETRSTNLRILARILQAINPLQKKTIPNYLTNILLKRIRNKDKYNVYANYFGGWGLKELTPKNVFGTPKLYKFEDTELYGANDYDQYLTLLYNNYMQLPPENKRHIHHNNVFWKE